MKLNPHESAFPLAAKNYTPNFGLTRREYYALHAPEPTEAQIQARCDLEVGARYQDVRCILRWEWADRMLAVSEVKP